MRFFPAVLGGLSCLVAQLDASAAASAGQPVDRTAPALVWSAGVFALVEAYDYPYDVGVEYIGRPLTSWQIVPALGLSIGPDGMAYLHTGIERDFALGGNWYLTPSLAGGYFNNGDSVGVHDHLEFQTGIAISRLSSSGPRWGIAGYHISNGGLQDRNNGTEAVVFFVRVPFTFGALHD
jgi:hypothetical protein